MSGVTIKQLAEARRMWREGATLDAISAATGINRNTLASMTHTHRKHFPYRKGETVWRARLAEVRGMNHSAAAAYLGTSYQTVSKWRKRLGMD